MRLPSSLIIPIAFCTLIAATRTNAMTFETKGKIVTVSGDVDYPDSRRLEDAYDAGVRVVVLKKIAGSNVEATEAIKRLINKLGMTTVIDGNCAGSCVHLFLGGKERYFAGSQGNGVGAFLAGVVDQRTRVPMFDGKMYASISSTLSNTMPFGLLNKYTSNWDGKSTLKISVPSNALPNGGLWDCPTGATKCSRIEPGLNSVSIGFITSNQLFDLEKQELVDVPKSTKATQVSTPASTAATSTSSLPQPEPVVMAHNSAHAS